MGPYLNNDGMPFIFILFFSASGVAVFALICIAIYKLIKWVQNRIKKERFEKLTKKVDLSDIKKLEEQKIYEKLKRDEEKCPICMDVMDVKNDDIRRMNCIHCYHRKCLETWLKTNEKCPACNVNPKKDNKLYESNSESNSVNNFVCDSVSNDMSNAERSEYHGIPIEEY